MAMLAAWFASLFLMGAAPDPMSSASAADQETEEGDGRIKFGGGTVSTGRPTVSP